MQLSRIKEMLQKLALLTHATHWSLIDAEKGKVLWQARVAPDLLSRVCDIRGATQPPLQPVSREVGAFRVAGVMTLVARSPAKPVAELYVNSRPLLPTSELGQLLSNVGQTSPSAIAMPTSRRNSACSNVSRFHSVHAQCSSKLLFSF